MTDDNANDMPCLEYQQTRIDDTRIEVRMIIADESRAQSMSKTGPLRLTEPIDATEAYVLFTMSTAVVFLEAFSREYKDVPAPVVRYMRTLVDGIIARTIKRRTAAGKPL